MPFLFFFWLNKYVILHVKKVGVLPNVGFTDRWTLSDSLFNCLFYVYKVDVLRCGLSSIFSSSCFLSVLFSYLECSNRLTKRCRWNILQARLKIDALKNITDELENNLSGTVVDKLKTLPQVSSEYYKFNKIVKHIAKAWNDLIKGYVDVCNISSTKCYGVQHYLTCHKYPNVVNHY